MATTLPVISKCSLPVYDNVCFDVGRHIVTAQPVYVGPPPNNSPYVAIAKAGIKTVLCVRDPAEAVTTPNPFDLNESSNLILNGVTYLNVPLPHINMTPNEFRWQSLYAAVVLAEWPSPVLVHCSTGDRASAAYAVYLILIEGYSPNAAADFAQKYLALANQQFVDWVRNYQLPTGAASLLPASKRAKPTRRAAAKKGIPAKAPKTKARAGVKARTGRKGGIAAKIKRARAR